MFKSTALRTIFLSGIVFFSICVSLRAAQQVIVISPADQATNIPLTTEISWHPIENAVSYDVEGSSDSAYEFLDFANPTVTDTLVTISGLTGSTTYFWHIRANYLNTTSDWQEYRFSTIPAPPEIPVTLAPAADSLDFPLNGKFIWNRADRAQNYDIQMATNELFTSPSINLSEFVDTTYSTSSLACGTNYYWRIRAVNLGGTSAWTAPSPFRTAVTVPNLLQPSRDTTNVSLVPSLAWSAVSCATSYMLEVATDSTFLDLVVNRSSLTTTTFAVPGSTLTTNTVYYWRVRAVAGSAQSAWAESSFETIMDPPDEPFLTLPENNALRVLPNAEFQWEETDRAATYDLQVSTDTSFSTQAISVSGIDTILYPATGLLPGTVYYWHVRGSNAGGKGPWSTRYTFTTGSHGPNLLGPANGSSSVPLATTLSWNRAALAVSYDIEVGPDTTFDFPIFTKYATTDTSVAIDELENSTTYYWRVRVNYAADFSNWVRWSFQTIIAPPETPSILLPENSATGIPVVTPFSWSAALRAATYRLQISASETFSTTVIDTAGITRPACTTRTLAYEKTYYWRVRAVNAGGASDWSGYGVFSTSIAPPGAPGQLLPSNNDTLTGDEIALFTWNTSGRGVEIYQIQVALDSSMNSAITDSTYDTTFVIDTVASFTVCYWRVRARNSTGWGAYSSIRHFHRTIPNTVAPKPITQNAAWRMIANNRSIEVILTKQSTVSIKLYSPNGRRVFSWSSKLGIGKHQIPIAERNFAAGIYLVEIRAEGTAKTKIIRVRS